MKHYTSTAFGTSTSTEYDYDDILSLLMEVLTIVKLDCNFLTENPRPKFDGCGC